MTPEWEYEKELY